MQFIKACAIGISCLFIVVTAFGQQANRDVPRRQNVPMGARGNWMSKRLMSKEFMEKVGIQGEQAEKLKAALEEIDRQSTQLEKEINQSALRQAAIAKEVLSQPNASVDEIMKIIEHIGALRVEQAKLATRRLVVIRDNLTAEQRKKASEFLSDEKKKNHDARERNASTNRVATAKSKAAK
jgi:hypothetical protein